MGTRIAGTNPGHENLRIKLLDAIGSEAASMPAEEVLAVFAVVVGQLIAQQDRRRFTAEQVMEMVGQNIELGNRIAIAAMLGPAAGRA